MAIYAAQKPISPNVGTQEFSANGGSNYTLADTQSNLRNFYLPDYKEVVEDQSHPLLTKIKAMATEHYTGNVAVGLIDLGVSSGAGSTDGTAGVLKTIGDSRHTSLNFIVHGKNLALNATIGVKASVASKGNGAWYDETVKQLDMAQKAHVNHKATSVFAKAFGEVAGITADATVTNATTFEFTTLEGNRFINGMGISFVTGATGTVIAEQFRTLKVVKKVMTRANATTDYEATITVSKEDGTAFTAATIAAATSAITFKFVGALASDFTGIATQLETQSGSLFNLKRDNYYFQGQISDAGNSTLDDQEIRRADDLTDDAGGDFRDILLGNREVVAGYEATLASDRRFTPADMLTGGMKVLSFDGKGFYKDAKSDAGKLYGLDSKTWSKVDMTGGLVFNDWEGSIFNRINDSFAYQVSAFETQEIFCYAPSQNFEITGIAGTK